LWSSRNPARDELPRRLDDRNPPFTGNGRSGASSRRRKLKGVSAEVTPAHRYFLRRRNAPGCREYAPLSTAHAAVKIEAPRPGRPASITSTPTQPRLSPPVGRFNPLAGLAKSVSAENPSAMSDKILFSRTLHLRFRQPFVLPVISSEATPLSTQRRRFATGVPDPVSVRKTRSALVRPGSRPPGRARIMGCGFHEGEINYLLSVI
jgi:hypothetical protein